jgi:hypothetical protein
MKHGHTLLFGALLVLASGAALADPVYRWVDSSGVVSYGTKPPANAQGLRAVNVDQPVASSGSPSADSQRLSESLADMEHDRLERQKAEAKAEDERKKAQEKRDRALLDAQREQHLEDCINGTLTAADCNDVSLGYYPVVGYRGPHPLITQGPKVPTPAPVVHQNSPVAKPAPRPQPN